MTDHTEPINHMTYQVVPIGWIRKSDQQCFIEILADYKPALKELENFSHVQVIWWFSEFDDEESRKTVVFDQMPFKAPPLGVFACRAPLRPNPIGLTTAKIVAIKPEEGRIWLADMDAFDGTPVLDLKAYMPSSDRVKTAKVPDWMSDWPKWIPEDGRMPGE